MATSTGSLPTLGSREDRCGDGPHLVIFSGLPKEHDSNRKINWQLKQKATTWKEQPQRNRGTCPKKEPQDGIMRAIERVDVQPGHPPQAAMIRALRMGNATVAAVTAARLYECAVCRRDRGPTIPKPSQLPRPDELNVLLAMESFERKVAGGNNYEFPGILCCGTNHHVVFQQRGTRIRRSKVLYKARCFMTEFADHLQEEGVRLERMHGTSAKWNVTVTFGVGTILFMTSQLISRPNDTTAQEHRTFEKPNHELYMPSS